MLMTNMPLLLKMRLNYKLDMSQGSSPRFLVDFWLTMGILKLNALVSGTTEEKGKDLRF